MNLLSSFELTSVWTLLIQHCLQITVLIVCVLSLVRLFAKNRPHLAHALWGLVLLKCLTPPIVALPLSPFSFLQNVNEPTPAIVSENIQPLAKSVDTAPVTQTSVPPDFQRQPATQPFPTASANNGMPSKNFASREPVSMPSLQKNRPDTVHSATVHSATVDSATVPSATLKSRATDGRWLIQYVIGFWAVTAVLCLAVAAIRLIWFLHRVRSSRMKPQASTSAMLESLQTEMPQRRGPFRRRVKVVVVDSLIGPAVVGLLRPTILVPRVLESECTSSELKILLAHELTHIRRGDLWWALVQTVARCLWWFHPLVYWVSRWFDRVTELSCDEETVASLRCRPAEYARSLLSVLERKHLLHSAPALPGVRPVEITAKRMERIMNLSNNATTQRPWWVIAVTLIGAALVLPGAALSEQEQKPDESSQPAADSDELQWSPAATPADAVDKNRSTSLESAVVSKALPFVKTYDASAALQRIKRDDSCSDTQAQVILHGWLSNFCKSNDLTEVRSADVIVDQGKVILRADKEVHQRITNELKRVEEFGFNGQVTIAMKFISIPAEKFSKLPIDWSQLEQTKDSPPVLFQSLKPNVIEPLLEDLQGDSRSNILFAPRVSVFNGYEARLMDLVQRPFVVGVNEPVGDEAATAKIRIQNEGLEVTVCPVMKEEEQVIALNVDYCQSTISSVGTFSFQKGGKARAVQVPRVAKQQFQDQGEVSYGHSLAYAMPDVQDAERVTVVMLTATPASTTAETEQHASAAKERQPDEWQHNEPPVTFVTNSDSKVYASPAAAAAAAATEPARTATNDHYIMMKADGPRMSLEDRQKLAKALSNFDLNPRFEGTWKSTITDEKIVFRGKNIAVGFGDEDGLSISMPSGEIVFDVAPERMQFHADSTLEYVERDTDQAEGKERLRSLFKMQCESMGFSEDGMNAMGSPVRFVIKDVSYDGEQNYSYSGECEGFLEGPNLELTGNVKFQDGDTHLSADRARRIDGDGTRMHLEGNVEFLRKQANGNKVPTKITASQLIYDFESGSVDFEDVFE